MLCKNVVGRYICVDSIVHQMNALFKIICIFIWFLISILNFNFIFTILLCLLSIYVFYLAKIPMKYLIIFLKRLCPFCLFVVSICLLFHISLIVTIRCVLVIFSFFIYLAILLYTTSEFDIILGFSKFFYPLGIIGISVNKLSLIITLVIRFIPIFFEYLIIVVDAFANKGIYFKYLGIKGKWYYIKVVLSASISLTIRKSILIIDSMNIKLYELRRDKNVYRGYKFGKVDILAVVIHLFVLLLVVIGDVV